MKIYFAASIRGGRDDQVLYQKIIEYLNVQHQVLTEHIGQANLTADGQTTMTDCQIRDRDIQWLKESDVVVAETTHPSLGVGYELAYAEKISKPVIILHQNGPARLSAMIAGTPYFNDINYYNSFDEACEILQRQLKQLAENELK